MALDSTLETRYRRVLTESKRIIIKVGTRVITDETGRPEKPYMARLVKQIAALHNQGREVILVSSGAVGAGMEALGIQGRPTEVPDLQMCAAVGQAKLMATYEALFSKQGIQVGQVLLTHADFADKIRLTNAKRALEHLLAHGVVPIINENDVVADEELKSLLSLGDNDYLAALVTRLTHAHVTILLSTVNGLLKTSPSGKRSRVSALSDMQAAIRLVNPSMQSEGGISKGGMDSKLRAADLIIQAGVPVVIASGRRTGVLDKIISGAREGTLILPAIS